MRLPQLANQARIAVIDSHTGGMPTRTIVDGFPELDGATVAERSRDLDRRFPTLRRAVVMEPRGNEPMVAALLGPPDSAAAVASVVFFDRTDVLGMCGHGAIGVVHTLRALGQIGVGQHRLDTPAGAVDVECLEDGRIRLANVPSRRLAAGVELAVAGLGCVTGDVAYGGNLFFLATSPDIDLEQPLDALHAVAKAIQQACSEAAAERPLMGEVNHIELMGRPKNSKAHARNYVLCPSGAYDRSPCGTGTSAKIACLAAEGKLAAGQEWVQESITGSLFTATYAWVDIAQGIVAPTIAGEAEIVAESHMLFRAEEVLPEGDAARDARPEEPRPC